MQAVVKPASTAPWVARKPAPPAPTTTTSNVWSMNPYARVELMLFLGGLGLDADFQNGVDAGDCDNCRKEIVQRQQDHFGPLFVNVVFENDLHPDAHMPCSGQDEQQHRDRHQWIAEIAADRRVISARQRDDECDKQQRQRHVCCGRQSLNPEIPGTGFCRTEPAYAAQWGAHVSHQSAPLIHIPIVQTRTVRMTEPISVTRATRLAVGRSNPCPISQAKWRRSPSR